MNDNDNDRRIDDELRSAFAPPPARELRDVAARVASAEPDVKPSAAERTGGPLWAWFAAAAALLSVLLIFAGGNRSRGPDDSVAHDGDALGVMWVAAYEDAKLRGFAGGCCESPFDLPSACQDLFDCRVDVTTDGSVSVLGAYCGLDTGGCLTLLAVDGATLVCVYVVRRDRDPRVTLPRGSTLHLARRELGDLVLYALSPAPVETALTQFVVP